MPESESSMTTTHRSLTVNGLSLHIAEQGTGPLVLLLHGFPESWYSWRHQIDGLAKAGYHVVAPDMRGPGASRGPADPDQYTIMHLVGDVVGLIHALGEEQAVIVGHDWGAFVAWHTALLRPEAVRAVAGLSVPPPRRAPAPPMLLAEKAFGRGFYQIYFQEPGVAEAELERDPKRSMRAFFSNGDPAKPVSAAVPVVQPGQGLLDALPNPTEPPAWLTEADLDVAAAAYSHGFTGGLNWYRNLDCNWELTAAWQGAKITPPSFFVTGSRDIVAEMAGPGMLASLPEVLTDLRGTLDLEGCGHWIQQERPDEVLVGLTSFIAGL